jgi:hypothetical protein
MNRDQFLQKHAWYATESFCTISSRSSATFGNVSSSIVRKTIFRQMSCEKCPRRIVGKLCRPDCHEPQQIG